MRRGVCQGGQPEDQITSDKAEVNVAIDDAVFKVPKKALKKPEAVYKTPKPETLGLSPGQRN